MSPPRLVIGFVAGTAFGAACAGLGLWLGSSDDDEPAATTLAASTPPEPAGQDHQPWVRAGEALLGPTALLPTSLRVEEGDVVLDYDLVDIAPPTLGRFGDPDELPVAAPETWTLLTTSGDLTGATSSVRARTARFPVPDGFDGTVTGARVDTWRTRMPLTHMIEISHDDLDEHVLDDGTVVALRIILEQSNSTLVQMRVHAPSDTFSAAAGSFTAAFAAQPQLSGVGPGWTNIGQIESGVQLTYVGESLPDPFLVQVRTRDWVSVPRPIDVSLEDLALG